MKYEEGDLVEIVEYDENWEEVSVGDIGTVTNIENAKYPYKVKCREWSAKEVFLEEELTSKECDCCYGRQVYHDGRHRWLCPFCEL